MSESIPSGLQRSLGLFPLVAYGVGQIVGAGIYSVIGAAAAEAQTALWLSFAVAAVPAFLTGLSYAELATTFPRAAAEYVYVKHAFPALRWAPFTIGMVIVLAGVGTTARVALAFAGYARDFVSVPTGVAALGLLAIMTGINVIGIRESSWLNIVFTLIEVLGLVPVIAAGVMVGDVTEAVAVQLHPASFRPPP